ncbi:MAG: phosphoribosylformylglycinamidine synthase subunit PurL [Acidobacteriia bacterium]|nr:phosphoribosylformylglycinamidine synthase subunit PurL [Terriglobia bacterium]
MKWDAPATVELAREHGLSEEEFERILSDLGRVPNLTELGIFAALWSEHCSYKSSRVHLKKFPTRGPRVIQGPGENAGVVDLGQGWVTVFKMESHNHPSFIEPYQGAATGVGGILRDVFTMGARPVMILDSLRFGSLDAPRMPHLVDGVVRGIGDYGNCVGVPTVGGEVDFHPSYNGNILVNAMCVGVARGDGIFYGRASGPGNRVVYLGSKTGRDGIHGATMASDVFDETASAKRPTVQVGDPFTEKLLIECCLELMGKGLVVGIQDMGAAGLTSSAFEMAARAGCGLTLDLSRVPARERGMTPYELMLSESQERMVLVVTPDNVAPVLEVCGRWGLDAVEVGTVIPEPEVVARFEGRQAFRLPLAPLVDDAPRYDRPWVEPAPAAAVTLPNLRDREWAADLREMLASPVFASSRPVWQQYDQSVGASTVIGPGADAALQLIEGTNIGLAATTDCNALACSLDPFNGAAQAVAEAVRNLACVGAEPVGVTDCLNFGSPENPGVMGQFVAAVDGLAEACRAFEVPVVSGNVSFYNETSGTAIVPTPTVGMVGIVPGVRHRPRSHWHLGDAIYLLGPLEGELGGSRYLQIVLGLEAGPVPAVDYDGERRIAAVARDLVRLGLAAAKDLSDGGLAVAAVEMSGGTVGCKLSLPASTSPVRVLFGEWRVGFALATPVAMEPALERACEGLPLTRLGVAGGTKMVVTLGRKTVLEASISELAALSEKGLGWLSEA